MSEPGLRIDRDAFAAALLDRLRQRRPDARFEPVEDGRIAWEAPSGRTGVFDTWQAWREADGPPGAGPVDLTATLDRWVASLGEAMAAQSDPATLASRLRVVVRPADVIVPLVEQGQAVPVQPLAGDVVAVLVEDHPRTLRYVDQGELDRAGLTKEQAFAVACDATWEVIAPALQLHEGPPGRILLTCGGNFELSLMMFSGPWEHLRPRLKGDPVVALPSRDVLVVTGADDADGLAALREVVDRAFRDRHAYLVSRQLLRWTGQGWTTFVGARCACGTPEDADRWTCATCGDQVDPTWLRTVWTSVVVAAVAMAIVAAVDGWSALDWKQLVSWSSGAFGPIYVARRLGDARRLGAREARTRVSADLSERSLRIGTTAMVAVAMVLFGRPARIARLLDLLAHPASLPEALVHASLLSAVVTMTVLVAIAVADQGRRFFDPRIASTFTDRRRAGRDDADAPRHAAGG